MWKKYFRFKLKPGIVITRQFGRIDFRRDDIPVQHLQRLYEEDFPYLDITDEGMKELYGVGAPVADRVEAIAKPAKRKKK